MRAADQAARLVLGTAQLGMAYGIANRTGRPGRDAAHILLRFAWDQGIRVLDTAQAYGDAEAVIGAFFAAVPGCDFQVVSKLPRDIASGDADAVVDAVRASVARIGRPLAAMLLHDEAMLDIWDHGLGDGLSRAIDEGLCAAAGVSVYCPERFAQALDLPAITVIQAPFNVFDRRLLDAGLLARAAASGRTVFLRSVFLQGLLTLVPDELPIGMGFAADALRRWRAACSEAGLAPDQAALGCALAYAPDAKIVIGCETVEQLARNLAVIAQPLEPRALAALDSLPPGEAQLIDPSQWPPHPPAVQEARP